MLPSNWFSLKLIHVFHKHIILSGLQSAIKMIHLIILAAVRKGYKRSVTCRILTCDSLVAGKTSLCSMLEFPKKTLL